ncbi:unnamed protein product, partial [Amoebophrya sp. A120]
ARVAKAVLLCVYIFLGASMMLSVEITKSAKTNKIEYSTQQAVL